MLLRSTLLLILIVGFARAEEPKANAPKTVRLLTVGNSFSGNATSQLPQLAQAAGHTLIHRPMSIGGASMEVHWKKVEAHEKDPKDPAGLYGTKNLKDELAAEPWDFVTIQQASIKSHNPETYAPFAKQLRDLIAKQAPKAEILIHETWAYRSDDPRFNRKSTAAGEPTTRREMYEQLAKAYDATAKELGLRVIPVGDAFDLADRDEKWGYKKDEKFDFAAATKPALPDQTHSLHVGWNWNKDGKLAMDGHHANLAGQYLGACVWLEVLFDQNPVGNTYVPKGLDADYAKFLQETAHKAVVMRRAKKEATTPR